MTEEAIERAVADWLQQEADARRWQALLRLVEGAYGPEAAERLSQQVEREIQRGEKG